MPFEEKKAWSYMHTFCNPWFRQCEESTFCSDDITIIQVKMMKKNSSPLLVINYAYAQLVR